MKSGIKFLRITPALQPASLYIYVCTYTDEVLPGGREAPSLEGSLPPLGSSSTTLGLEMSPSSAGDMKCPRGGRAVKEGFVWVNAGGRVINIESDP